MHFSKLILASSPMASHNLFLSLFLSSLPIIICLLLLIKSRRRPSKNLPPGSLGLPFIGQSVSFIRALLTNNGEEWIRKRVERYGPVSKVNFFGYRSVLLAGTAANKFVFANVDTFAPHQPRQLAGILGTRNMNTLHGEEYRRVKAAVMPFLRPEMLKGYVGRMDAEARLHIKTNWTGRRRVKAFPLMKSFTFDVICSLLFDIERGVVRDRFVKDFADMLNGLWANLIGLPFLNMNKSIRATRRVRKALDGIIQEKKATIEQGENHSNGDLISYLISLEGLSHEEIVDNAIFIMIAGYDTTSILISFIIRQIANDPISRARVTQEQEKIANSKVSSEEALTWDDIAKMKYTWLVANEMLRIVPTLIGSFRKVLKDVEYGGYDIPKGWSVYWVPSITHMDANIFPEPTKFDPTRFENPSAIPPYSILSFGGGPRTCPGFELARLETLVMLHYLVTKFRWKLCCKEDVYNKFPMPSPVEGLPIQLEPKIGSDPNPDHRSERRAFNTKT